MDQIGDMKYNDLLKHAKDLGITFTSSKPKKEQILELISGHHEKQAAGTSSKSEGRKTRKPKVDYNEAEEEPKKKKVKKVKLKSSEVEQVEEATEDVVPKKKKSSKSASVEVDQVEVTDEKAEKVLKKKKKIKKAIIDEAPVKEVNQATDPAVIENTPVKKVKKSNKIKANLKVTETDEMKRVRKSIMEKKLAKISKSNKELAGSKQSAGEGTDCEETKKEKKIKFSEKGVDDLAGEASSKMKRRILNKKKKSSSPTLKPAVVARRVSDRQTQKKDKQQENDKELERSLLQETNKSIESQEICDEQFQLQLDSEDDTREAAITESKKQNNLEQQESQSKATPNAAALTRKSIAFTIDTTTPTVKESLHQKTPSLTRKSIAFTIDTTPSRKSILTRPVATTTPMAHQAAQRRSIAFTIDSSPKSNKNARPSISTQPSRKSIVIEVPVVPEINNEVMTDDEASTDKTYRIAEQVASPAVSCKAFYKHNATLDITNDMDNEPEKSNETTAAIPVPAVGRARIVRPTEVKKVIETVVDKNKANDIVVRKVVEVVRREAGPRITKPSMPEATNESSTKKQQISAKKAGTVSSKPKPVNTAKKVPDFKAIHEKNFNKSEDISEAGKRVINRHNQLFGSQTKVATTAMNTTTTKTQIVSVVNTVQEPSIVSSLMSHATNLLKRIAPFNSNEDTENSITPNKTTKFALAKPNITSHIPKMKIGADKIERPPFLPPSVAPERDTFSTSLKPRTPLGARNLNSMRTPCKSQQLQATTPCQSKTTPKTPQSNNKPKNSTLLLSASKKPVLSKPFHFQNQNLEINFGSACQFGTSTGKTPLKDSAFQRRKSYNPKDSIGRPLTYNPHQGRLKPLETTKIISHEDTLTSRANAAVASHEEKRKSMLGINSEKRMSLLGIQKNLEKDNLGVKRKLLRNTGMDSARPL